MMWPGRLWAAGLALGAGIGIGIALHRAPQTIGVPAATDSPSAEALPAPTPPTARVTLAPPDVAAAPPGVSAEQWAALRAEHAGRPAELRRLADYFVFADQLGRFRAGRAAASSAERAALARALDASLDERLRQRELSAGEARLVKMALLEVLHDDEAARSAALGRWESQWKSAAGGAPSAADAEFQRRQAAIVAAWSALPTDQRDARALERELDALRRSSFDPQRPTDRGAPR